jgi:hypothetical protein
MGDTITPPLGLTHFFGDLIFQWVPGLLVSLAHSGIAPGSDHPAVRPVTVPEAAAYFRAVSGDNGYYQFFHDWSIFVTISILLSLIFAAVIIYSAVRLLQVREFERNRFAAMQKTVAARDVSRTQLRWSRIKDEISSENEQSWRLAILEADIMLNELLDSLGYRGETMADKMRGVERGDFNTIDLAWEAHRARNTIAHQGAQVKLEPREARRIIGLYERIFREFKFINEG